MSARFGAVVFGLALVVSGLPVRGVDVGPGVVSPVAVTEAVDEVSARAAAMATGRQVEVVDQRTETARVFVNPSGSLTLEQHSAPVRVQRDGQWVGIDPSLRVQDGRVVPAATAVGMSFSAGGSDPFLVLDRGGKQLSLSWPTSLPAPTLSGDTATYPEILPGVDLQVRAEPAGARFLMVVKTREAAANPALARLSYRQSTRGLKIQRDAKSNAVSLVDDRGAVVFAAGTPLMWDSTEVSSTDLGATAQSQSASGTPAESVPEPAQETQTDLKAGRKVAAMPVEVDATQLVVVPDQHLLTAADTVFPVMIDPWFTATTAAWTYVNKKFPDQSYWSYGRDVGTNAGYESTDGTTQRAYFRMGTSTVNGKDIISATFKTNLYHSWTCSKREVQLWAGGDIGSNTTWNNQPWRRYITSLNAAKKSGGTGECVPGVVEFDAKSAVAEAAANNYGQTVLSLQAPVAAEDAKDTYFWKKFSSDPTLVIEYNSPPDVPSSMYADINLPCATGTNRPVTNSSPTLWVTGTDADTANVEVEFEWYHQGGNKINSYRHPFAASGSRFSAVIPTSQLQDGQAYGWRARTGDGRVWGPWSGFCEFGYDTSKPTASPTVTSTSFDNDFGPTQAGQRGEFTFTSTDPDVYGYRYGLTENTTYFVAAGTGTSRPATVPLTADISEPKTLFVYSVDKAGNTSTTPTTYSFYPDEQSTPSPHVKHDVNADALADMTIIHQVDSDESAFLNIIPRDASTVYPLLKTWDSGPNTAFPADRIKTEVGDFNGDGKSDILVLRNDPSYRVTAWLFYANGTGYTAPAGPAWDSGTNSWDLNRVKLVVGDFSGDGKDDVGAFYNYDNNTWSIWAFKSTGTGLAAPTQWWSNPAGWSDWNQMKPVAGDFNGDGKVDVGHLYNYNYGQTKLWVHYSTGAAFNAGSQAWDSGTYAWEWSRTKPVVADVNADGKSDLVAVYNYDNATFRIWTFLATATAVQAPTVWWNNPAGWADWNQMKIVAGDFNGDGRGDIGSFYNYANQRTAVWTHTSTGTAFGSGVERWNSGDWGLDWSRSSFH